MTEGERKEGKNFASWNSSLSRRKNRRRSKREQSKARPFKLQMTASVRERPLLAKWSKVATMPTAAVRELMLLFVAERGLILRYIRIKGGDVRNAQCMARRREIKSNNHIAVLKNQFFCVFFYIIAKS